MKRVSIILAAALAALLLFAACGQTETAPVQQSVSLDEASAGDASAEPAAEEPVSDTPAAGRYTGTAVESAAEAASDTDDESEEESEPESTAKAASETLTLTLLADDTGTIVESGTSTAFLWHCADGELTLMLADGRVLTGEIAGAGSVTLLLDGVTYAFTRAEETGDTAAEAEAAPAENSTDTPANADPNDENNIYGAEAPEAVEDDTPAENYITLGDYGAVSSTDAGGSPRTIDGDIIHIITAETDSAADVLVKGKGTYLTSDSYILFRYELTADGMFHVCWCDSGPDEFTGDFMEELMTGPYMDDTLILTDENGAQTRFELDAVPEQTGDYQYTADNNYGDALPCAWD